MGKELSLHADISLLSAKKEIIVKFSLLQFQTKPKLCARNTTSHP